MILSDILFGRDRGMTRRELRKMTERSRLSTFFPWDEYDGPSGRYFVNADKDVRVHLGMPARGFRR